MVIFIHLCMKSLDQKLAEYVAKIQKLGDVNLLTEVKKAQDEAKEAAKKARSLHQKYLKSIKKD